MKLKDTVVFGGSFNPPHQGHVNVVARLLQSFRLVVVAPTLQNPYKTERAVSLEHRARMFELLILDAGLPLVQNAEQSGIFVSRFSYTRTYRFVEHWRETFGTDVSWCIGPDLADEVKSWEKYDQMQLKFVELSQEEPVRSSDIRAGRLLPPCAIQPYIAQHSLYGF